MKNINMVALLLGSIIMGGILFYFVWDLASLYTAGNIQRLENIKTIQSEYGPYGLETLLAQQTQANTAIWQVVVSLLAVLISAIALIFLAGSLRLTKQALGDTREIGEAQTTCYIHASDASWGINRNIIIHCQNTGMTPAVNFSINGNCLVCIAGNISSSLAFKEWPLKNYSALASNTTLKVSLDDLDMREISKFMVQPRPVGTTLVITGTIYYRNVFGKSFSTQFAFFTTGAHTDSKFRRPTSTLGVHMPVTAFPNDKQRLETP